MLSEAGNSKKVVILRVYTTEGSFVNGQPVHEKIVLEANKLKLITATVYRGVMGFDKYHHIHKKTGFHLSDINPLTIEIVDTLENIEKIYPCLKDIESIGIATLTDSQIVKL